MSDAPAPDWIIRHGLNPGEFYATDDSDLVVQYLGYAQVRDSFGFQYVMVFREESSNGPLLTLVEEDADACAGFSPVAEKLLRELRGLDDDSPGE